MAVALKKLKSELSTLERKIQLTLAPKQGVHANDGDKLSVTEMQIEKCADILLGNKHPIRVHI